MPLHEIMIIECIVTDSSCYVAFDLNEALTVDDRFHEYQYIIYIMFAILQLSV